MSRVTLTQISNGDAGDATVVDYNFDTLAGELNGNLDSTNLADNAVTTAKLTDQSVTAAKASREAWTAFRPAATGFSGSPTVNLARYFRLGNLIFVDINVSGTSSANSTGFSLPVAAKSTHSIPCFRTVDNGVPQTAPGTVGITASSTTASVVKTVDATSVWTGTGAKSFQGSFFYEAQ